MERWDLFDRNGSPLGRTIRRGDRLHSGEYHQVVHIWVVNSVGRLLIQLRSPRRKIMPNVWAVTSGSAVSGEETLTAARRELAEELGIVLPAEAFLPIGRIARRNSLCNVFLVCRDVAVPDMHLQREEVSQVRWVTPEQLGDMVHRRQFHHYGTAYFRFVFDGIARLLGHRLEGEEALLCLHKN